MPDNYKIGHAHRPWTTLAGHYLGMQPVVVAGKPNEVWYRGDDYMLLVTRVADHERELAEVRADRQREHELRVKLAGELETLKAQIQPPVLTDSVARKPPKRAS